MSVAFAEMEIGREISLTVTQKIRSVPTGALAVVAVLLWVGSALYTLHFGRNWHLDLRVYRAAGHELFSGGDPFAGVFTANRLPFTYPPFALLVLSPLAFGPLGLIEGLWWLLSSIALVALLFVLLEAERARDDGAGVAIDESSFRRRSLVVALALGAVATLALEPVRSNMNYGQVNLVLMVLIVLDLTRSDSKWRGVMVGLASAIKLTPLIYLAYFLFRRDRASFVRGLVTFVAANGVAWSVLPTESARYWFHEVTDAKRAGDVGGVSNQSWEGLLNRAPFHGGGIATVLFGVLGAATLACGLLLARRLNETSRPTELILALALVELLVSPISWTHHWSWLVLAPLASVSLWGRHRFVAWLLVALVVIAVAAPYWWVRHGPISDLASNSLVITGALALVAWTAAEMRGARTRPS